MKKIKLCLLFQLILFNYSYAGLLGPSNYEDCVLENLKNAKTDLAVQTVYAMCSEKYKSSTKTIEDCSVTWNGKIFEKGRPTNINNYQRVEIINTTHEIYLPANMDRITIGLTMKTNIEYIKKICPFK